MKRKWMRRAAVAAALMATLALAAPAWASGRAPSRAPEPGIFQAVWQWIVQLWPAPEAGQAAPQRWEKNSGMIDPDGNPKPSATGSCSSCDNSGGVDPDG